MYFFDYILIATVHCMFQTTRYGSKTYAQELEQDSEWLSKFTMPCKENYAFNRNCTINNRKSIRNHFHDSLGNVEAH